MENRLNNRNYSYIAKFFHWGFVILFIYGLIKQVQDIEQLDNPSLLRFEVLFASVFVVLLIMRFIYMKSTQKTSLPENTPKLQKIAAKTVHYGMYFTLAAIPVCLTTSMRSASLAVRPGSRLPRRVPLNSSAS